MPHAAFASSRLRTTSMVPDPTATMLPSYCRRATAADASELGQLSRMCWIYRRRYLKAVPYILNVLGHKPLHKELGLSMCAGA